MNFAVALNPLPKKMNKIANVCKELPKAAKETWKNLEGRKNRIIESFRLEKTFKIIESHH